MQGNVRTRQEPHQRPVTMAAALTAAACIYYLGLLTDGDWNPFGNELCGLVFNDMLARLLHGDVTIDPAIIRGEGYLSNGRLVTYWGVFPAFLRLPLLPLHALYDIQIARLSCWIAVCLVSGILVATLTVVYRRSAATPRATLLFLALVAGTLFAGVVVSSLASAYVYNEPLFWAVAFGVMFNYVVLRRLLADAPLAASDLLFLASLAGLALNSRVLEGIGLYLAMGWILLVTLFDGGVRKVVLPATLLAAFLILCGTVNYLRWGSPLTFMDLRLHIMVMRDPAHLAVLNDFGALNLIRLPFSFAYYFLGTTYIDGLVSSFPRLGHLYGGVEGPTSALALTEAVPLLLAGIGIDHVVRRPILRSPRGALLAGVLAAQIVSIVPLLAAEYLAMRYRLDFLPAISFAAALGYFALTTTRVALPRLLPSWVLGLTILSIVVSYLSLVAYKEEIRPSKEEARQFWEHYRANRPTAR